MFGDGAAACLVLGEPLPGPTPCLALQAFHCGLAPEGTQDMAWHIGDFGFEMTLSGYVPALIERGIGQLTADLLHDLPVRREDIRHFALHPGGRKILEAIEKALNLSRDDNRHAYRVLREFGNMSSATVLFVLRELLSTVAARRQRRAGAELRLRPRPHNGGHAAENLRVVPRAYPRPAGPPGNRLGTRPVRLK